MKNIGFFGVIGGVLLALGIVYFFGLRARYAAWISLGEVAVRAEEGRGRADRASLPPLVQRYADRVLAGAKSTPGPQDIHFVMLKQSGQFWTKPDADPSAFEAVQYQSVRAPAFSWTAHIMTPPVRVIVVDRLVRGQGELQARVLGAFTVQEVSGREILKGQLLRYLAEIPWAPQSIVFQKELKWEQVDASHVDVSASIGGETGKVRFEFGADGLVSKIRAEDRPYSQDGRSVPMPWEGEFTNYKEYKGFLLPARGSVSWILPSGKFTYFQGDLLDYAVY